MKNGRLPANPLNPEFGLNDMPYIGLTKREEIASRNLAGLLAANGAEHHSGADLCGDAVSFADDLLAELERTR